MTPSDPGTQWIGFDARFLERQRRTVRWVVGIMAVALALAVALMLAIVARSWGALGADAMLRAGLLAVAFALYPFLLAATLRMALRRRAAFRLGASGESLRVVAADLRGRIVETVVPWSEVHFDGARILAGRAMVLLRYPVYGEMFDRGILERAVIARIPAANRVSRSGLEARLILARPMAALAVGAVFVALALALVLASRLRHL